MAATVAFAVHKLHVLAREIPDDAREVALLRVGEEVDDVVADNWYTQYNIACFYSVASGVTKKANARDDYRNLAATALLDAVVNSHGALTVSWPCTDEDLRELRTDQTVWSALPFSCEKEEDVVAEMLHELKESCRAWATIADWGQGPIDKWTARSADVSRWPNIELDFQVWVAADASVWNAVTNMAREPLSPKWWRELWAQLGSFRDDAKAKQPVVEPDPGCGDGSPWDRLRMAAKHVSNWDGLASKARQLEIKLTWLQQRDLTAHEPSLSEIKAFVRGMTDCWRAVHFWATSPERDDLREAFEESVADLLMNGVFEGGP